MSRITETLFVKAGKWLHWSKAEIRFYFRNPKGAKIRVRYVDGWFSKNRQKKTVDGRTIKIISLGG